MVDRILRIVNTLICDLDFVKEVIESEEKHVANHVN